MKKLFLFTAFLLLSNLSFSQDWFVIRFQNNPEYSDAEIIWSIFFLDEDTGFACIEKASVSRICKTTNGGVSWSELFTNTAMEPLKDITFIDSNVGFAVGAKGKVLKTTDGGLNWVQKHIVSGWSYYKYLVAVEFFDSNNGWAVGSDGKILVTSDGGESWAEQTSNTTNSLYNVYPISSQQIVATGNSVILTSNDGGATWTVESVGTHFWGLTFIDNNIGFAAGGAGHILKTSNGGGSWTLNDLDLFPDFKGIEFYSSTNGWAVGGRGGGKQPIIFGTTDAGETWVQDNLTAPHDLECIFCLNDDNCWAAGRWGTVLKFGSTPSSVQNLTANPFLKVFPNPSGNYFTIEADAESTVQLTTLHGQVIAVFSMSETLSIVDITSIPSGIYIVSVCSKKGVVQSKIVKQ